MTKGELKKLLDPKNVLKDQELRVKEYLYMKYPRPLTKKEKAEVQEEKDKQDLDNLFQTMYGTKEDSEQE